MPNHTTRRLYQVLTPQGVAALQKTQGRRIIPGHPDDAFVLLKWRYSTAKAMAEHVWSPRFGWAAVVALELPRALLRTISPESVVYAAHREYRLPVDDLAALSVHLQARITVLKTAACSPNQIAFRSALGYVDAIEAKQPQNHVQPPTSRGLQAGLP